MEHGRSVGARSISIPVRRRADQRGSGATGEVVPGEIKITGEQIAGTENSEFASLVITFGVSTLLKRRLVRKCLYYIGKSGVTPVTKSAKSDRRSHRPT